MIKAYHLIASSAAGCMLFAQAALAGNAYTPDPVVKDSESDAGIILLLAIGALLVVRALAAPKPADGAEGTSETSE